VAAKRGRPPAVIAGDLTLVRPLGWHGIPVIAAITDPDDPVLRSRYVQGHCLLPGFVPPHDRAALAALTALGDQLVAALGRPVPLFYGQDGQLELLYHHRETLARSFLFVLNDEELAWSLHDKARFFKLCESAGVRVPATVIPDQGPVEATLRRMRPPLVVKPREKSDWKDLQRSIFDGKAKARVFGSAEALLAHPGFEAARSRLVVQEYVDGRVTDLFSFHGFATPEGRLLAWFCGRKLRTHPAVAGESALLELVRDPVIEAAGREVWEKLGLRGPFKIDLIRDPRSGLVYTLEVNARFNLWHHLGAAHGVNLPLVAYDLLVDGRAPAEPPDYQPHLRWLHFYRDLQAFRDDPGLSATRWLGSLIGGRTLHETFAWTDPLPFVAWAGRLLRGHLS
jgi:predicted ATP-grasp superfamily ATP-dependent carboligase